MVNFHCDYSRSAPQLRRDPLGGNLDHLSIQDMAKTTSVTDYIATAPPAARRALKQLRTAIKAAAPGITERISYRIPMFALDDRYLLYIAAFKEHVSVYPVTAGMVAKYGKVIAPYRTGKGTLRFPLNTRIPIGLVAKLAKVRVQERRAHPLPSRSRGRRRS